MQQPRIHERATGKRSEVIVVDHVFKSFKKHHVLVDFSLRLLDGESLVILGKSGAGKSVLIKCIIGLLMQDRGSIKVFGQEVSQLTDDELDKLRTKVGFLFQSNALYDSMTVRDNLEFSLRRHWLHMQQNEIDKLVLDSLDDVGLVHTIDMMPAELSGGMRKRIALARTLILKPKIILYDEPTTGLDTITGKEIITLMIELQRKYHTSSLIISHDMNCVKIASDKVVILWEGKNYAEGTYHELMAMNDSIINQFFE